MLPERMKVRRVSFTDGVGIRYGQTVPGGWCPHDLRHTSLTETQRYLKFMPQSVELAASVSARLAFLANVDKDSINSKQESSRHSRKESGGETCEIHQMLGIAEGANGK